MDKVNFANGKDGKTPVTADNLNQLQTNVENAIKETETKVNNKCLYLNTPTLMYLNSTTLSTTVTINGLGAIESKSIVLISCLALTGTPYESIINFSYTTNGDNLTINAHGSSFVDGHVLAVKVLVYYNG